MFEWLKKSELSPDEVDKQIEQLWQHHNRLSMVVAEMSELLKKLATATAQIREDLDFLGNQTMSIVEQQNKLVAQIMRNEDLLSDDKIKSTSLH